MQRTMSLLYLQIVREVFTVCFVYAVYAVLYVQIIYAACCPKCERHRKQ